MATVCEIGSRANKNESCVPFHEVHAIHPYEVARQGLRHNGDAAVRRERCSDEDRKVFVMLLLAEVFLMELFSKETTLPSNQGAWQA